MGQPTKPMAKDLAIIPTGYLKGGFLGVFWYGPFGYYSGLPGSTGPGSGTKMSWGFLRLATLVLRDSVRKFELCDRPGRRFFVLRNKSLGEPHGESVFDAESFLIRAL